MARLLIKVLVQTKVLLQWIFDDLRTSIAVVETDHLEMIGWHVECVLGLWETKFLMDPFLNLFVSTIHLWLIIVNSFMAVSFGLPQWPIFNMLKDKICCDKNGRQTRVAVLNYCRDIFFFNFEFEQF